jgi:hypothetical protein
MDENNKEAKEQSKLIKELLRIDRPRQIIADEIANSLKIRNGLFSENALCSGMPIEPYPERYFVAQEFNETKDDLRRALEDSLRMLGFSSISAEDYIWTDKLICKISALIQGTPFGIYQLSASQNRNVYLELGIAIGLNKPFVLVKDKEAIPASTIHDIEYYQIDSYLDTKRDLGGLLEKYITYIGNYQLIVKPVLPITQTAVISHWESDSVDVTITIAQQLKSLDYNLIILGEFNQKLADYLVSEANVSPKFAETRDEIFKAIQISKFGVFRVDEMVSANNFVALGITIGINRPFLPIISTHRKAPFDLSHLVPLKYAGSTNLEKILQSRFEEWLNKYVVSQGA